MTAERILVVNADDFGRSRGINAGVAKAHESGVVTSASLVVRWPAAREAADYALAHPRLSLGLHVDLGEWVLRDGGWKTTYEVVPVDERERVAAEVEAQLEAFVRLVGKNPTHLDSHQHVHLNEPTRSVLARPALELGVPLRHVTPEIRHCAEFYGQAEAGEPFPEGITVARLVAILRALPPGVTELTCHPGEGVGEESNYAREREVELETLCDPRVLEAIAEEGIALRSFSELTLRPL
jgi:predicted glycoside hydrolase/deacetylase ChbG (UPF0249 family)